jgi:tetratricopeptide (TPR) repeat protein
MKNTIYICGDSVSQPGNPPQKAHWSKILEVHFPELKIKNLSYVGATNFSIVSQIEAAIADKNTAFVIVNGTDIYRLDVPNKFYTRETKKDERIPLGTYRHYDSAKEVFEKLHHENYKNPLVTPENLYDAIANTTSVIHGQRPDPRKKLGHFGMWMFDPDKKDIYEENITAEVFDAATKYFDHIFNLNEKYYSNLYMLESALYKLKFRGIPFLYNMGALTTKVGYYYELFSEIIEKTKKNPDLADHYCDINLSDHDSTFEQNGEHQINDSHIGNVDVHIMVADEYSKRIRQCLQN